MTEVTWAGGSRSASPQRSDGPSSANLADILERILDKGIVVVGDIRVNLLDIELLTIKLRLLIASVDRAKEMGIDWWEHDPTLSSKHSDVIEENRRLRERLAALEGGDGNGRSPAAEEGDGSPAVDKGDGSPAEEEKAAEKKTAEEKAEADRG
ncbi:gas vesicle protein [Actinoallomurus spadix]|uniref:Gas vesicle structural protein n=1 Tax=Actinoallomurus spadix TaxID=79912 RepID=A0ABN0VZM8_9ACTN|nr:gas vesicle protein [Actinoallomurus spadix]MCO5988112.1 gas vesicle protein [Actinoallomurus spadix]